MWVHINPFLAGVVTTILVEFAIVFVCIVIAYIYAKYK